MQSQWQANKNKDDDKEMKDPSAAIAYVKPTAHLIVEHYNAYTLKNYSSSPSSSSSYENPSTYEYPSDYEDLSPPSTSTYDPDNENLPPHEDPYAFEDPYAAANDSKY